MAWAGLILVASSGLMSAEHTSRFIGPVLRWMIPEISAEHVATVQFYIRKAAHVTEYAVLALLLMRALGGEAKRLVTSHIFIALALTLLCAATDELHQSFVRSRTGSSFDVMLDLTGALIGVAAFVLLHRRRRRPRSL